MRLIFLAPGGWAGCDLVGQPGEQAEHDGYHDRAEEEEQKLESLAPAQADVGRKTPVLTHSAVFVPGSFFDEAPATSETAEWCAPDQTEQQPFREPPAGGAAHPV